MFSRRAQDEAGHHGDLESGEGRYHGERIGGIAGVLRKGGGEDVAFVYKACVVETRAAACCFVGSRACENAEQRAGGGGIADAHLADANNIEAGGGLPCEFDTALNRG